MGIRPAKCFRDMTKVAWTRFSRSKPRKSYIKSMPHRDLNTFRTGTKNDKYDAVIDLVSSGDITLRDNALESARQTLNKHLETAFPGNYYLVVRAYPHHIIRENKMIAGAGADRLQKGMRQSFGIPTDRAARLKAGSSVFTVYTFKQNLNFVKSALTRCKRKLSGSYTVQVA